MKFIKVFLFLSVFYTQCMAQQKPHTVKNLKITILSTMMAQAGVGEWGFSALIEADSLRILFDAGGRERTVWENSKELGVDLTNIETLILSHNHGDHTIGWIPLRTEVLKTNPRALSKTHVAKGFFDTRYFAKDKENTDRQKDSIQFVQNKGIIFEHEQFTELFPGIYLTGQVPRVHPEKNYPFGAKKKDASGKIIDDTLPEDMSLVIRTEQGLVLLSGCGHAGIINTATHIRNNLKQEPVVAALGGFHLFDNTDEQIKWTAEQLKMAGIRYFMGAHCTGIEPVYQIRTWAGLKRGECIVGSVGSSFDSNKGFFAGPLAK